MSAPNTTPNAHANELLVITLNNPSDNPNNNPSDNPDKPVINSLITLITLSNSDGYCSRDIDIYIYMITPRYIHPGITTCYINQTMLSR